MKTAKQFIQDHQEWLDGKREDKPIGRHYYLEEADFEDANLKGANLKGADFEWTVLNEADLEGADLRLVDLCGLNLEGTNLKGVNIEGATVDLYESDIVALTEPLFRLMEQYNKKELLKLIKEMEEN